MENWLLLYLILKLDSVIVVFGIATAALAAVGFGYLLLGLSASLYEYEYDREKLERTKQAWYKQSRKYISFASAVLLFAVLIPSTKDIIVITGGVGVLEAAKTDQAREIASKSVLVVEKFLNEYLREVERKEKAEGGSK